MNNLAFYGTGECDPSSQATASLLRLALLVGTIVALVFVYKKYFAHDKPWTQKAVGVLLSIAVVVVAAVLYFVLYAATACGR